MQIMDQFIDNDPDNECSPKAKQDKVFLKYPAIKKIKKKKKVRWGQTLDVCIMKKPRILEDTQPGLSSDV